MREVLDLAWAHKVSDIRDRTVKRRRASDAELAQISQILGDVVCRSFETKYEIVPCAPGHYRVAGRVMARVEQTCGVTLDPFEASIDEAFDVEFRAGARRVMEHEPDFDALGDDDPEPIEQGYIQIGRFVCEILGSVIDPFPRGEDASLDVAEAGGGEGASNPFAVLEQFKDKT